MRQAQKVLWTKGVLLSPQHLQTQDRFLEALLASQLTALAPYPWGFSRLTIDREALSGGSLALTSAAGLFADGLAFDIPAADAAPAPKPIAEHWNPDAPALPIYLGIPEYRPGSRNVAVAQSRRDCRYTSAAVALRDENTGLAERPIQLATKNLRLLTGGENLEGNALLQLARVVRSDAGEFELDARFVPPLLDIGASDSLMSIGRRVVENLSARSSSLAGVRRQRNQSLADFGIGEVANFWLLYTVNTHLPWLRHLVETRRGHPLELYRAMLQLAGALTTFSSSIHPRDLPGYDHTDAGACFGRLEATVGELLETVVPATSVAVPLRMTQPSVFAASFDDERHLGASRIYLAINSAAPTDELIRKAPQLIKISSADRLDGLMRQALPGLPIRHEPNPTRALPIRLDHQYFELERGGPDWDAIRASRNLAAFVPSDFPESSLELLILLPPRAV